MARPSALEKRSAQRHVEEDAELAGEVDADPRVDAALLVEEAAFIAHRERALVPDARTDVDPEAAVAPERDELLRADIVAGQRGGDDERSPIQRPEELA